MSMSDIAISARNISKCYRVYDNQRSRLLNAVWPSYSGGAQQVWALKDVSFDIQRGESLGIIGRNGGGKSTLLEILCGTLTPTTGTVTVSGRISALLELGSGFNPEYSGRDNVILNGLLLGLSRDEILERFGEIESFAEIGAAIDRPVKTYSSGMMMRLAFAVQVLCDPDILIVDEALSVGDFFFQQKCFARLRKMRDDGLTLLFVSHDMGTVRDLCSTALYLVRGETAFHGDSKQAIRAYLAEDSGSAVASADESALPHAEAGAALDLAETIRYALWHRGVDSLQAPSPHRLLAIVLRDQAGNPVTSVTMGGQLNVEVHFRTLPGDNGHISISFKNKYDQIVCNTSTYLMGMEPFSCSSGRAIARFEIDLMLEAGQYSLMFALGQPTRENQGNIIDTTGWIGPLRVDWDYAKNRAPFLGMFGLPARAQYSSGGQPR